MQLRRKSRAIRACSASDSATSSSVCRSGADLHRLKGRCFRALLQWATSRMIAAGGVPGASTLVAGMSFRYAFAVAILHQHKSEYVSVTDI